MSYDQRRIYLLSFALIVLAIDIWSLIDDFSTTGVLGLVAGVLLVAMALSGRGLRQRVDDPTDPRNS